MKVGMTNASLFAYVANGKHGMAVLELMGPHTTPQFRGFAPPLDPQLIATFHTHGPAPWPDHRPLETVLALRAESPAVTWFGTHQGLPTPPGGTVTFALHPKTGHRSEEQPSRPCPVRRSAR